MLGLLFSAQINSMSQEKKAQSAIDWSTIWITIFLNDRADDDSDAVHYESRKEHGEFVVEVAARACLYRHFLNEKELESGKDSTRTHYKQLSNNAEAPKSTQAFYRCMSELENPSTAVESGEYRKCLKRAWNYRPWFTPAKIDVRENKFALETTRKSFCRFDRFERKDLPQWFLD